MDSDKQFAATTEILARIVKNKPNHTKINDSDKSKNRLRQKDRQVQGHNYMLLEIFVKYK